MSLTTEMQRARLKPIAWLEIDGFPTVFYSGTQAPTGVTGLDGRTLAFGVNRWTGTASSLDLAAAIPEPGRLSVTLAPQRDGSTQQLLRLPSITGGGARSTLLTTLDADATTATIFAADSIADFPASGVLHIGQEAIQYSAKDDGLRTFTVQDRGYLGSQIALHVADASQGWAPRIYANACTWPRRPARLWVCNPVGSRAPAFADAVCEIDGYISGPPQIQADGLIEVEIESVSAILQIEVGGTEGADAGLQHGWHAFDGVVGDRFDVTTQVYANGSVLRAPAVGAVAIAAGSITIAHGALGDVFDLGGGNGDISGYIIGANSELLTPTAVVGNAWDGTGSITLTAGEPLNAIGDGQAVTSARVEASPAPSCLAVPGVAEVVQWPSAALATFNTALALDPTSVGGSFAVVNISLAGYISATPYVTDGVPGPLLLRFLAPTQRSCWGVCIGTSLPAIIGGRVAHDWPAYIGGRGNREAMAAAAQRAGGWAFDPEQPLTEVQGASGGASAPTALEIGGVADAFYQPGSRWIHADANSFGSPTAARPVPVLATTQWRGEEVQVIRRVRSIVAASTITGGASGWLLEVDPRDRGGLPLVDFPGEPATTLRAAAALIDVTPGVAMLRLLLSVAGNGENSAVYDVLPLGAALKPEQVDIPSFLAFASSGASTRSFIVEQGTSLGDVLSALARSVGAVVVERLQASTGRRVIALQSAGLPAVSDSVAAIASTDWTVQGRPISRLDASTINAVVFEASWLDSLAFGAALGEVGEYKVTVTDRDSAAEVGETSSETIPLYGFRLNTASVQAQRAALLPIAAARFAAFGFPRRTVVGTVPYRIGVGIDPGAVVTVAGAEVLGYDGQPTTAPLVARVTSVDRDCLGGVATIEATVWDVNTAGWSPALRVTGAPTAASVTVEPNFYAPALSPAGAAQVDADFFATGDPVLCVPRGNYTGATARAVVSIVGSTVTLDGAHGLAAGDSIRPQDYGSTSARLQTFAFLADAATLLLASSAATYRLT
jgi:hypothetical protein